MFLIAHTQHRYKKRLVCFQSKPWTKEDGKLFLFSGTMPSVFDSKDQSKWQDDLERRRYSSDKIQKIELISKMYGSVKEMMLVI